MRSKIVGDRTADRCLTGHRLDIQLLSRILLLGPALLLAACGQVVTPSPTQASQPLSAPPTASRPSVVGQATAAAPGLPPPDTATPTITPTPVVHIVQQGDTLQAIAFDYGVSVEALQRANGIENPQFLQVDQRLVVPLNEEGGDAGPGLLLATPTPHPIEVRGVAFYETPVGSLWGLGEVANTTTDPLTNVQVKVTLFDQDGQAVTETDVFAAADVVLPGGSSPFGVLLTTPPTWASYQVTVIRGQKAGALADGYVSMALSNVEGYPSGSQFEVSGTITNVSAEQFAEWVDIIVTTYDARGAVTGFRQHTERPEEGLAPGANTSFSLLLATHGGTPDDVSVIALGRVGSA